MANSSSRQLSYCSQGEDFWRERLDRTVRLSLPTSGRPYTRADFLQQVNDVVGLSALQALGPTSLSHVWEITFKMAAQKAIFVSNGDFVVKGLNCAVNDVRKVRHRVRLHWVPYYVPMSQFESLLTQRGCKVISASFDVSAVRGCEEVHSLIRTIVIETDQIGSIPYLIHWTFAGMSGQALLTMTGRPPVCLKCEQPGHMRKDCRTDYCRKCKKHGHLTDNCVSGSYAAASRVVDREGELVPEDDDMGGADFSSTASSAPVVVNTRASSLSSSSLPSSSSSSSAAIVQPAASAVAVTTGETQSSDADIASSAPLFPSGNSVFEQSDSMEMDNESYDLNYPRLDVTAVASPAAAAAATATPTPDAYTGNKRSEERR